MPEDEKEMKALEYQKEILVEEAITENETFKRLKETIERHPGIKINVSEMVSAYMDYERSSSKNNIDVNKVNDNLVNEIIRGTIYSISKEENGLVIDSRGVADPKASMEQYITSRYMGKYNLVEGLENLTEFERQQLIQEVGEIVDIEKRDNVFKDNEYRIPQFFSWRNETGPFNSEDIKKVLEGEISEEEANAMYNKAMNSLSVEEEAQNQKQYIEKEMERNIIQLMIENNGNEEAVMKLLTPEEIDFIETEPIFTEAGGLKGRYEEYKESYLITETKKIFKKFDEVLSAGGKFDDLGSYEKRFLYVHALKALEDENASTREKMRALIVCKKIASDFVIMDENGNYSINQKRAILIANGLTYGTNITKYETLIKKIDEDDRNIMLGHVVGLKGRLISRDDYFLENPEISDDEFESLEEKMSQNYKVGREKALEKDSKKRLGLRIESELANFTDMDPYQKQKTVMAAYFKLMSLTNSLTGLDASNYTANLTARNMLEKYITDNPSIFGDYIDTRIVKDDYGNEKEVKKIKKYDMKNLSENYISEDGKHYAEMDKIWDIAIKTAVEEIGKNASLREKMLSDDNITVYAGLTKDLVKGVIKLGARAIMGKKLARKLFDKIKANENYKKARDSAYKILGESHKKSKKSLEEILSPVKRALAKRFPTANRLALPSANNSITVGDISLIKENAMNRRFITSGEAEMIKQVIEMDYKSGPERTKIFQSLKDYDPKSKFITESTGEFNVDIAQRRGLDWKNSYITEMRVTDFELFNSMMESPTGSFENWPQERKMRLFRSAFMAFEDKKSSVDMKVLAGAVLKVMDPNLVMTSNDGNAYELKIVPKEVIKFYETLDPDKKGVLKTLDQLKHVFDYEEAQMALEKVNELIELDKKGKLKNEEEHRRKSREDSRTDGKKNNKDTKLLDAGDSKNVSSPSGVKSKAYEKPRAFFNWFGKSQTKDSFVTEVKNMEIIENNMVSEGLKHLGDSYTEQANAIGLEAGAKQMEEGKIKQAAQSPVKQDSGMEK